MPTRSVDMPLTKTQWDDAIFYCEFMSKKETFGLPGLKDPKKVPLESKKKLINDYCKMLGDEDEVDIEKTIDTFAVQGVSIRSALGIVTNWKQVLLSKLTSQNLLKARCFQSIDKSDLEAVVATWRKKATNLKLSVVPNFVDNTAAGGVEIWISYKDIQYGAIPTMFALGHEFGHQTDFSIRDTHPQILKVLYENWKKDDHKSWEYYADTFAIIYLSLISGDRTKLMSSINDYMGDTPDDGIHPEGRQRVNQMRISQMSI